MHKQTTGDKKTKGKERSKNTGVSVKPRAAIAPLSPLKSAVARREVMESSAAKGRTQGRLLVSTSLDVKDELEEVPIACTSIFLTYTSLLLFLLVHSLCLDNTKRFPIV